MYTFLFDKKSLTMLILGLGGLGLLLFSAGLLVGTHMRVEGLLNEQLKLDLPTAESRETMAELSALFSSAGVSQQPPATNPEPVEIAFATPEEPEPVTPPPPEPTTIELLPPPTVTPPPPVRTVAPPPPIVTPPPPVVTPPPPAVEPPPPVEPQPPVTEAPRHTPRRSSLPLLPELPTTDTELEEDLRALEDVEEAPMVEAEEALADEILAEEILADEILAEEAALELVPPAVTTQPAPIYTVQLAVYKRQRQARRTVNNLAALDYLAYIRPEVDLKGKTVYAVRVGHFNSAAEARQTSDELLEDVDFGKRPPPQVISFRPEQP